MIVKVPILETLPERPFQNYTIAELDTAIASNQGQLEYLLKSEPTDTESIDLRQTSLATAIWDEKINTQAQKIFESTKLQIGVANPLNKNLQQVHLESVIAYLEGFAMRKLESSYQEECENLREGCTSDKKIELKFEIMATKKAVEIAKKELGNILEEK